MMTSRPVSHCEWDVQNDKKLEIPVESYKLRLLVFVGNFDFNVTHW